MNGQRGAMRLGENGERSEEIKEKEAGKGERGKGQGKTEGKDDRQKQKIRSKSSH